MIKLLPRDWKLTKSIFLLALPIIISNLSRVIMNITDTAMVGRLELGALSAVGMGGMCIWTITSLGIAFRTGIQTMVSRRLGEKNIIECGHVVQNGLTLAVIIILPISASVFLFSPAIVPFLFEPHQTDVINLCIDYVRWSSFSIAFTTLGFAFSGFFSGIEKTGYHLEVTIASNLLNVYLNAGLIFGSSNLIKLLEELSLGWLLPLWSWIEFPELGVKGAAIATSISSAWLFFHYFIRYLLPVIYGKYSKTYYIDRIVLRRLIQLCTPIGAQLIIVHAGFVIFMKLVAKIGTIELDATEIIFVIASASFMPAAGLGQACATTIGKLLGENNHQKAYLSVFETMRMTSVFMGVMGIIFFLFPQNILSFFTNNQIVIDAGSLSLKVLGLLQIFDAMSQTLWFSLNGAGDTKFPAITEILIMWLIFLPGCWYFVTILEVELVYLWLNFSFYLILMTFILYLRIRSGKWMKIKV